MDEQPTQTIQNETPIATESQQTEQDRTIAKKREFLKWYARLFCVITTACEKVQIGRATLYRWRNDDETFRMAMDMITQRMPEMVEEKLKEAIMQGDMASTRFFLRAKHPDYKLTVDHNHTGVILNLYGNLTDQQLTDAITNRLERIRLKAREVGSDIPNGGHPGLPENGGNPQASGSEAQGDGKIAEGDISHSEKPPENNDDHDIVRAATPATESEPEDIDHE